MWRSHQRREECGACLKPAALARAEGVAREEGGQRTSRRILPTPGSRDKPSSREVTAEQKQSQKAQDVAEMGTEQQVRRGWWPGVAWDSRLVEEAMEGGAGDQVV